MTLFTRRVSEMYRYDTTVERLNQMRTLADRVHETGISGRKLFRISDDPVASVRVMRNRTKLLNIDEYRKTMEFARGFLSKTEDAMMSIGDALIRAKELSIQQANSTYDDVSHRAVAAEIKQIIDHIIVLGNTTFGDKYIFGGFKTDQPPVSPEGNFLGDDGLIFVQLDEDSFRPINVIGRELFDVPPEVEGVRTPLIQTLRNLYVSLVNDDKDLLHKSMVDIDTVFEQILTSTASLGARRAAIEDVAERQERSEVRLHTDNNLLEGADPVKSALDLRRVETALDFSLKSSSKILSHSLLDFLK
jgi:flagellar hook-associated protein 3 FlgL